MKKTAIITGSTSGIGLVIARYFASNGYNIALNGLDTDGAMIAGEVASANQADHIFSPANMQDTVALRQLVNQVVERWGRIDVLVNNAGVQHVAPIELFPDDKWDELIGVNLTAPFQLIKAVWPAMKRQQYGRIINIASAHGLVASELKCAYVAAKHGLVGLTKTAALEGAPYGITCNAICPGYVSTALVSKQVSNLANELRVSEDVVIQEKFLNKHAIKEFVSAESVAAMCYFLTTDAASTITGSSFPIDAGWTAQ